MHLERFSPDILRVIKTIDTPYHKPTHASAFLVWYSKPTSDIRTVAELGSGTGVVAFALAKLYNLSVEGIEIQSELVELAQQGAKLNGLEDKVSFKNLDVKDVRDYYKPETFDMIVSNFPFHVAGRGKESPYQVRRLSRAADLETINSFIQGASYLLRNRGTFVFVFSPSILLTVLEYLDSSNLTVQRMCFLHGTPEKEAKLVVVRGKKNGGQQLVVDPPQWGV
ncbi:tRNA1(Val) A37 N6-methylase TrmN6 [Fervidobacterium changbaicum]|uniref:Methyltransferase n=2 Tax=Fervidobacterium TaxID=2422 RepID=A0AAI8CN41_FERIS|nr:MULTISPECIES: methyltransferase [Fervidobacterium]AMW33516.1 methyltransferase [Fervidobacterium islandicum]QAV33579.1 methyltransferase domain-containing protein [Fervidobacterium changbaicum]SDH69075.1 tRNA1(Val) A37 N6-methylase TrmN6 [Fervidobacterium changbaicum]